MAGTTPLSTLTASLPSFPTSSEIADNLRQAITGLKTLVTNFNTGGLTQTYLEAIACALGSDASKLPNSSVEGAYEILNTVMRAAYIATASGFYLDLKCADVGVYRKPATSASTGVILAATVPAPAGGTVIAAGALVSSEPADPTQLPIIFATLNNVTLPQGAVTSPLATVQAIKPGSAGNTAASTITAVLSGATSLSVVNPAAAIGGADQEGDDAPNGGLRARGLAAILNASQCTLSAIANAALSYSGITSALCADYAASLDGGATTFFQKGAVIVYCDDGTGDLGNPADVNNASLVQFNADLKIGKWRSAGASTIAVGSRLLAITVALTIDFSAAFLLLGNTETAVQAAVAAAIYAYVEALPLAAPVLLASIIEVAKAVPGVSNVIVPTVMVNGIASDKSSLPFNVPRCVNGPADVAVTAGAITAYA